jgi:hypothetical protein
MGLRIGKYSWLLLIPLILGCPLFAQISPGDLAEPHSALEGMSNCTQCHTLGAKISNEKCLACHTEIKERVDANKGYHSSTGVAGKTCVACHNDHHGRTFEIIRFEKEKFDHNLAGYKLEGAHSKKACGDCHKADYIKDPQIKKKKYSSYLGLNSSCTSCHKDYHQNTLSQNCSECHTFEAFKPASKFDHNNAKFKLAGKHQLTDCIKCHKPEIRDGKQFQKFTGIPYANCTNCHTDVHKNQFGQDCRQCHSEESFHIIRGMENFDHNLTEFKLIDKHQLVSCKSCHKTALTDPINHDRCADCHADYHNNQFAKQGISPDCSACHNTIGFAYFSYTLEQHNVSPFPLEGAHVATPCFECHKKTEKWNFREIGIHCKDCHPDIHNPYLDKIYYPENNCKVCHSVESWRNINFDHNKTKFTLEGTHQRQTCRTCHFKKDEAGNINQRFSGLTSTCATCHQDVHRNQFEIEGITDCARCHGFDNWKDEKFDHNTARFVLDGKHINVACEKCHKIVSEGDLTYVQYKLNEFKCESCHR